MRSNVPIGARVAYRGAGCGPETKRSSERRITRAVLSNENIAVQAFRDARTGRAPTPELANDATYRYARLAASAPVTQAPTVPYTPRVKPDRSWRASKPVARRAPSVFSPNVAGEYHTPLSVAPNGAVLNGHTAEYHDIALRDITTKAYERG